MIELDTALHETIGARAEQQDAAASVPLGSGGGAQLLVLADGLGGHADGARASRMVIEAFGEAAKGGLFDEPGGRRLALHGAIHEVNKRIHEATDPMDGHRSMASTAVAAILANGTVRWISVGDSHLYVCRNGRLSKLNADHSQAGIMIRHGYSPNDEAVINARSVLVSALTGRDIEEIDNPAHDVALEIGDVVLLASDGLNTLSDTEIALAIDQSYDRGAKAIADVVGPDGHRPGPAAPGQCDGCRQPGARPRPALDGGRRPLPAADTGNHANRHSDDPRRGHGGERPGGTGWSGGRAGHGGQTRPARTIRAPRRCPRRTPRSRRV